MRSPSVSRDAAWAAGAGATTLTWGPARATALAVGRSVTWWAPEVGVALWGSGVGRAVGETGWMGGGARRVNGREPLISTPGMSSGWAGAPTTPWAGSCPPRMLLPSPVMPAAIRANPAAEPARTRPAPSHPRGLRTVTGRRGLSGTEQGSAMRARAERQVRADRTARLGGATRVSLRPVAAGRPARDLPICDRLRPAGPRAPACPVGRGPRLAAMGARGDDPALRGGLGRVERPGGRRGLRLGGRRPGRAALRRGPRRARARALQHVHGHAAGRAGGGRAARVRRLQPRRPLHVLRRLRGQGLPAPAQGMRARPHRRPPRVRERAHRRLLPRQRDLPARGLRPRPRRLVGGAAARLLRRRRRLLLLRDEDGLDR